MTVSALSGAVTPPVEFSSFRTSACSALAGAVAPPILSSQSLSLSTADQGNKELIEVALQALGRLVRISNILLMNANNREFAEVELSKFVEKDVSTGNPGRTVFAVNRDIGILTTHLESLKNLAEETSTPDIIIKNYTFINQSNAFYQSFYLDAQKVLNAAHQRLTHPVD